MSENATSGKKNTATTTDESSVNQSLPEAIPEDAVLRKRGIDCTFYYRVESGTLVERAVHDEGYIGDVFEAGGNVDPESDDVDVLEADAWPTRDEDSASGAVLVADGGENEDERSVYEIDLALRQTAIVAVEADTREEAWEKLSPPLDRETQRELVTTDFSGAEYEPVDVIAVDDVEEADIVVSDDEDDGLRADGGSKYFSETGDGYVGTYTVRPQSCEINAVTAGFERGEDLALVPDGERMVRITRGPCIGTEALQVGAVNDDGYMSVLKAVQDHLNAEVSDELRLYETDGEYVLVNRDDDPFVATDGGESVYSVILEVVDELESGSKPGAPVGDVIEETLSRVGVGLSEVAESIEDLHSKGEIYQPGQTTVRRVAGEN